MEKLRLLFQKQKAKKISTILMSFNIVYILMIPVILYYLFIAADRYVSSITLSVRSMNSDIAPVSGLASLVGINTGAREDVLFLQEYIHSLDMLKILDKDIHLKLLYQAQQKDPFFALSEESDQERFLKFYQDRVKVIFDDTSGLLKVDVEGFTPQDAQIIANAILKESEKFVNEVSHKAAREQMAFAEKELLKAKERLQNAKNNLLAFQARYGVFD